MMWIRIRNRSDRHHIGGFRFGDGFRAGYGFGSVTVSTKCNASLIFFKKFQYTVKNIQNYDIYDADEKDIPDNVKKF
jgi:hypothetical protein